MELYIAVCKTTDPEKECGCIATEVVGIFSSLTLATAAFAKVVKYPTWEHKHTCYEGQHEVASVEMAEVP